MDKFFLLSVLFPAHQYVFEWARDIQNTLCMIYTFWACPPYIFVMGLYSKCASTLFADSSNIVTILHMLLYILFSANGPLVLFIPFALDLFCFYLLCVFACAKKVVTQNEADFLLMHALSQINIEEEDEEELSDSNDTSDADPNPITFWSQFKFLSIPPETSECPICLDTEPQCCVSLPCKHLLHVECFLKSISSLKEAKCPYCRVSLHLFSAQTSS